MLIHNSASTIHSPQFKNLDSGSPYQSYAYAYPHKTAYRRFATPVPLQTLWADEKKDALFLYLHIPFCQQRCGYCNLFSLARPHTDVVESYLQALQRQATQIRDALGTASFAKMAIGGGTPTYLDAGVLDKLFTICRDTLNADSTNLPVSVEASPNTADAERLSVLQAHGVSRLSLGVQSFHRKETAALGRAQDLTEVKTAVERIRRMAFPILNIDLIYGIPGQTKGSWLTSIRTALRYAPEEIYLYPLYTRPLTTMWQQNHTSHDLRLRLYREARHVLLEAGYQQQSMRMFRRCDIHEAEATSYRCQEDGMIGLGCGPRSYTRTVHYSTEYAVTAKETANILRRYLSQPSEDFQDADYGFHLNTEEQQRRYVIKSLFRTDGVVLADYADFFDSALFDDLPELLQLEEHGFAGQEAGSFRLTPAGLERSDLIGPWLYSPEVRDLMKAFPLQ